MEIIVTHIGSDFDSFAGMVAAKKIYPQAQIILSTAINQNVRKFIALYEDELPLLKEFKEINLRSVEKIIVIDTKISSRIGPVKNVLANKNVEILVYDHHRKSSRDVKATHDYSMEVCATTTILVNIIMKKEIAVSPLEATLFILGIYEDTGSFMYPGTSFMDMEAAAYLLKKEANLFVVSKFLNLSLTDVQHRLLEELIMNCQKVKVNEKEVLISQTKVNNYIEGLSVLTRKLSQIEDVSTVFCWVKMKDKTYVVARTDDKDIDVSKILSAVGGGGHPQAASAVVKNLSFEEIKSKITSSLKKNIKKPMLANDIMSYPVRVVNENERILKVSRILKRYGHSGIPIVDSNKNLVGIITRKDIDKAMNHGLSHAPVKGFKSRGTITANPGTTVDEIQSMMIENSVGRIPILHKNKIVGIVTRKDILKFLYGQKGTGAARKAVNYFSLDIKKRITSLFPKKIHDILKIISDVSEETKCRVYLVGGIVRDILLGISNFDIDVVVETDGIKFGKKLANALNAKIESHKKFKTSVIVLGDGQHIDVATARIEYYKKPAALPSVEPGSIRQDLSRRDFTINTMALSLNKENFGEIMDFFGGRKDLKEKRIKVLHKMSFIEDPTRIFRAVRFEQRLGFTMDDQTEKLARTTIEMDIVKELTGVRIRDELVSILDEEKPWKPLKRLYELGALRKIGLNVEINPNFIRTVKKILSCQKELQPFYGKDLKKWRLLLVLLLRDADTGNIRKWCYEMKVRKKDIDIIVEAMERWNKAKESLKNIIKKNSILYGVVSKLSPELQAVACSWGEKYHKNIKRYLTEVSGIKLSINGETLKGMGYKPSKKFKYVLEKLFEMKLDGKIKNIDEEINTAKLLIDKINAG